MSFWSKIQKVEKLPGKLKNLYSHRIIRDTGWGLIGIFEVIFLFELLGGIKPVLLIFLAVSALYFLFLPLWARLLKFFSMHVWLALGTGLLFLQGLTFYFLAQETKIVWAFIILLVLFNVFERLCYWIPYHVDFARFVDTHHKGRRLSYLSIVISLIGIILPVFSAFVINKFSFDALFIFASLVVLVAILPAFFIPRTRENYSFGYGESFRKLLSKRHVKTNLAYFADGFQSGIGFIVWPIFIFMLLKGEYLSVGLVSGAIILTTCVLHYATGEVTDKFDRKKLIKTGSVLYSLGWVFKAIAGTALHVFLAGTFHSFVAVLMRTPFDAMTYDIAADQGHYVDEFTVLREMSLHLGRVSMIILSLVLVSLVDIVWIFVLGALVSLLLNLVSKEEFVY